MEFLFYLYNCIFGKGLYLFREEFFFIEVIEEWFSRVFG